VRYGVIGENLLERTFLATGMAPRGLLEGYLKVHGRDYRPARHVRRWLLTDRPRSLRDAVLMERVE
jgi:hypothetical protein